MHLRRALASLLAAPSSPPSACEGVAAECKRRRGATQLANAAVRMDHVRHRGASDRLPRPSEAPNGTPVLAKDVTPRMVPSRLVRVLLGPIDTFPCNYYNGPGPRLGPRGFTRVFEILTCMHFFRSKCGLANMHAFFSAGLVAIGQKVHACISTI